MKLFPLLGMSFAFLVNHSIVLQMYKKMDQEIRENQNYDSLEIIHHFTSAFKAVYSQIAQDGLFTIR